MGLMANLVGVSSFPLFSRSPHLSPSRTFSSSARFKSLAIRPVRCFASRNTDAETDTSSSSSPSSISTYNWCAALGGIGFVETGYLTYLKLTNSAAFCPIGGGTCSDVLNSDYAVVFGVPLPLIGMVAYGLVAAVGLHLAGKNLLFGLGETNARLVLLGSTTSMAAASAYFLYLLSTKLAGASCSYCLFSAFLSFSMFFITLKDFGLDEVQKVVGLQLSVAAIVVAALSASYSSPRSEVTSMAEIDLEPFQTEITTQSSPLAISLAKHLHSIGAKMYGAFWCSHCLEQKQMFGHEAAEILDYVECFPDGVGKGRKIADECKNAGIEGFPTWMIKGKVLSGEQNMQELIEASGFVEDYQPT